MSTPIPIDLLLHTNFVRPRSTLPLIIHGNVSLPPPYPSSSIRFHPLPRRRNQPICCRRTTPPPTTDSSEMDCVGTGLDVECLAPSSETDELLLLQQPEASSSFEIEGSSSSSLNALLDWALLVSPFFFWGTAMVAMKEVLPKTGPFFVATFRLIPAGLLLVGFAAAKGRKLPSGAMPWLSITLFALVDAACFQVGGITLVLHLYATTFLF